MHITTNLDASSAKLLLQFHAFTGCDSTSYFTRHTKKTCIKTFFQHKEYLKNLGNGELSDNTIQDVETFVCIVRSLNSDIWPDAAKPDKSNRFHTKLDYVIPIDIGRGSSITEPYFGRHFEFQNGRHQNRLFAIYQLSDYIDSPVWFL